MGLRLILPPLALVQALPSQWRRSEGHLDCGRQVMKALGEARRGHHGLASCGCKGPSLNLSEAFAVNKVLAQI
ncbi:hypothetical protein EUGRSUZ_D01075 [Eucalyptus grandis]|uniref:Uncharacterized protein n=2 Tax=Eucalyptus grandis TaxID=71139 RepID=A0ACC3L5P6_EUCGR|nr:hypothetical protein EUGRSUZ_D01075 [Eucalyptus grandis]